MSWEWKGEEKLGFLGGFVLGGTIWEQPRKDWEVSKLFRVREITEHRVIASSVSKIHMERRCQEKIFAVIDVACCKHVFSVIK
jgi:hypothetical protein